MQRSADSARFLVALVSIVAPVEKRGRGKGRI